MIISAIVAVGNDLQIGADNKLLWHVKEDFKHFKNTTMGHTLIMGRKSYESIGRALPGRATFVLSQKEDYTLADASVFSNIDSAIAQADKDGVNEVFITGGGEIYKQTQHLWDRLYLSTIDYDGDAEVYFPKIDRSKWNLIERSDFSSIGQQRAWRLEILEKKS